MFCDDVVDRTDTDSHSYERHREDSAIDRAVTSEGAISIVSIVYSVICKHFSIVFLLFILCFEFSEYSLLSEDDKAEDQPKTNFWERLRQIDEGGKLEKIVMDNLFG